MSNWSCLYCTNERKTFKSFDGLRKHVVTIHLKGGVCPICNERYRNVRVHIQQHAIHQGDLDHMVLYGLTGATKRSENGFKDKCKKLAEDLCEVR